MSAAEEGPLRGPQPPNACVAEAAGAAQDHQSRTGRTGWGRASRGRSGLRSRTALPKNAPGPVSEGKLPQVRTLKLPYRAYGMARVVDDALYVTVDSGTGLIDTALRYDLGTG